VKVGFSMMIDGCLICSTLVLAEVVFKKSKLKDMKYDCDMCESK
jgi:hypothetical protein